MRCREKIGSEIRKIKSHTAQLDRVAVRLFYLKNFNKSIDTCLLVIVYWYSS